MEDLSLEREFEMYKLIHKMTIVQAQLEVFYDNLKQTGIQLPNFMDKTPQEKAKEHLANLLNDRDKFERTYKSVWALVAEVLP